jgi:ribose 5-phosphate isomerase A
MVLPPPIDLLPLSDIEKAKREAAYKAVSDHFRPEYQYVGIGSGSTVVYVVEAIAALGPHITSRIIFVPTGFQSRELIIEAGLPLGLIDTLVPLASSPGGRRKSDAAAARRVATGLQDLGLDGQRLLLDVVFDGADEVDEQLNCIKGGGACLLQEKLVATSAKKFVCVADHRKYQPRLLTRWKSVPIEIVQASTPTVIRILKTLGSPSPKLRLGGSAKAGPIVTDNGNFIVDAPFQALLLPEDIPAGSTAENKGIGYGKDGKWEVTALARRLIEIVGVVEVGIFAGKNGIQMAKDGENGGGQKPVAAYFGMEGGDVIVKNSKEIEMT